MRVQAISDPSELCNKIDFSDKNAILRQAFFFHFQIAFTISMLPVCLSAPSLNALMPLALVWALWTMQLIPEALVDAEH